MFLAWQRIFSDRRQGLVICDLAWRIGSVVMERNGNGQHCLVEQCKRFNLEGFWGETDASCTLLRPSFVYPYMEDSSGLDLFVPFYMVYKFNNAQRSNIYVVCCCRSNLRFRCTKSVNRRNTASMQHEISCKITLLIKFN